MCYNNYLNNVISITIVIYIIITIAIITRPAKGTTNKYTKTKLMIVCAVNIIATNKMQHNLVTTNKTINLVTLIIVLSIL